jgi:hypothetical protein
MARPRSIILAVLALALVALPASVAAQSGKKVKLAGGATTLVLDADTADALTDLGLTLAPLKPSKARGGGIAFKVTSGRLNASTFAGRIDHSGGLRLSAGSTRVDLRNFRILTGDAQLTAKVGKARIAIADLEIDPDNVTATAKRVRVTDVGVRLTGGAAKALNQAFGTDALKGGLLLGTAEVDARRTK